MTLPDFLDSKREALNQSLHRVTLAVDSSTQLASVALSVQGRRVYNEECFRQKSHSEWINGAVERAIQVLPRGWRDLELLALTEGPGSFTGLRVASNLVKTLAYSFDLPIVTLNSLELLAHQATISGQTRYILPLINAFKNRVFGALYRFSEQPDSELGLGTTAAAGKTPGKKPSLGLTALTEPQAIEVATLSEWVYQQMENQWIEGVSVEVPLRGSQPLNPLKVQVVGEALDVYGRYFSQPNVAQLLVEWCFDSPQPQECLQGPAVKPAKHRGQQGADPDHTDHTEVHEDRRYPKASTLLSLVNDRWNQNRLKHWSEIVPLYIRASAAEESQQDQASKN